MMKLVVAVASLRDTERKFSDRKWSRDDDYYVQLCSLYSSGCTTLHAKHGHVMLIVSKKRKYTYSQCISWGREQLQN